MRGGGRGLVERGRNISMTIYISAIHTRVHDDHPNSQSALDLTDHREQLHSSGEVSSV